MSLVAPMRGSPNPPALDEMPSRVGHYAGFASRFLAFVVDIAVSLIIFALVVTLVSAVVGVVAGSSLDVKRDGVIIEVLFGAWVFLYFSLQWASNGRTLGMALFGVRVLRANGMQITGWRAMARTAALPLSFLFLGLGFLIALGQRERRALHDLIAGTCVVYSWNARAATLRWLVREENTPTV
jgi:uncharacterized RDD family membrane protein YckC